MIDEVQRENSLHGHVYCRHLELLKKYFDHFLLVLGWVHVGLSEQDGVVTGRYFKQIEGMFPEKFHVVPMINDAMSKRVLKFVQSPFVGVELLPNIRFLLVGRVGDDHIVFGPADSAWKEIYMEGKTKGNFSSPPKPTFISPLP